MPKIYKMSKDKYNELKNELKYLKDVREKEVAEQIKEARSFGDLSENSEYDEAKTNREALFPDCRSLKYCPIVKLSPMRHEGKRGLHRQHR